MTFKITNIRVEDTQMIAFYEFSNGESVTNRFPLTSTFAELKAWGDEKLAWFEQRELAIEELKHQIVEVADGSNSI